MPKPASPRDVEIARRLLKHWHEAVPNDRMAHLVKDVMRMFDRALQMRLTEHEVSIGHWPFLRALWAADGLTQRCKHYIDGLRSQYTREKLPETPTVIPIGYVK